MKTQEPKIRISTVTPNARRLDPVLDEFEEYAPFGFDDMARMRRNNNTYPDSHEYE